MGNDTRNAAVKALAGELNGKYWDAVKVIEDAIKEDAVAPTTIGKAAKEMASRGMSIGETHYGTYEVKFADTYVRRMVGERETVRDAVILARAMETQLNVMLPEVKPAAPGVAFGSTASAKDGFERKAGAEPEAPKAGYGH